MLALATVPAEMAAATTGAGADISWPQCQSAFPAAQFGIVGVNGPNFAQTNQCLAQEWEWALATGQAPQAYILAADPGPGGTFWTGQGSEACDPSTLTAACAYDYGEQGAANALTAMAGVQTQPTFYWVDVEGTRAAGHPESPSWQQDQTLNAAEVRGELDELRSRTDMVSGVGLYTSGTAYSDVVGAAGSFAGYPVWAAGGACGAASAPGGPVTQVQATDGTADTDTVCGPRLPSAAVSAQVAKTRIVTGSAEPNTTVTVTVTSLTKVRLATAAVPVDRTGHWAATVPFTQDATVTATDANGASSQPLKPRAEVHVTKVRTSGCTATVSGSVAVTWKGQTVQLKSGRTVVAKGGVSGNRSWKLTVRNACGLSVTPYVDGKAGKAKRTEPSTSTKRTRL